MSNGLALKSLQEKVSLTLFVVMGALAVVSYVTLHEIVAPTFDRLEYEEARTNLVRAERAIRNDLDNLNAITGDWGLWDDAYDYVRGEYPAFENSNLDRPTLTNLGLNLLAVYDGNGDMVWGQLQIDGQPDDVDRLGVLTGDTHTAEFLIKHTDPAGQFSGLLRTDVGPMLFSSWPVVKSDGSGPIAGTMIMGQFLNDERIAAIRDRTEVQLTITPIDPVREVFEGLEVPLNVSSSGSMLHTMTSNNVISTAMLADLFGEPLVLLDVQTRRDISSLGNSTVDGALLFLALSAVIVAIVTWLLLRRIIVTPLARMADHIVAMRKSGDLSSRLDEDRRDEIGALSNEFDRLTDELDQARRLLLEQSFKAGKADTAAEVLHNIRNAMTPMINGIDRLSKNFDVTRRLKVKQALEELASGECPPERAAKMLQYLESAFAHIEASNEDAAENLAVASKQARHVEAILADQEKHAMAAPVVEKLSIDEVLDEAVLVIPNDDVPNVALKFEDDVHAVSVKAHRVSLLQVMGNIILNAYESIQRSETPEGRIDVSVCEEVVEERPMVRLTVCDNGGGFDETTGEKIFQRGFSSKEGNLSGLGLHWCANALAGMGGRIDAVSDGPGRGAKIHVLLPAAQGGQV